jgi:hypothetical protein
MKPMMASIKATLAAMIVAVGPSISIGGFVT